MQPVDIIGAETGGLIASVSVYARAIPSRPDEHLQGLLDDAIAVGNATGPHPCSSRPTCRTTSLYEGGYWKRSFFGRDYRFLLDGESERNLDARTAGSSTRKRRFN